MKTKDVTAILKKHGWETYRDDANDTYARYHFPDRIVSMGYKVKNYGGGEGSLELVIFAGCMQVRFALLPMIKALGSKCMVLWFPQCGRHATVERWQVGDC
ncbi:hypothetical protein [Bartonella sp. B17]